MSLDGVREGDRLAIVERWTGGEMVTGLCVVRVLATRVVCSDGRHYKRSTGALVGGGRGGLVAVPWTAEHDALVEAAEVQRRIWALSNELGRRRLTRGQVERLEAILAESESVA